MQQALSSRAALPAPLRAQARGAAAVRTPLLVVASKKVTKKAQVVLTEDVPNLGAQGLLTSVRLGYFRCGSQHASAATACRLRLHAPIPRCHPRLVTHSPVRRLRPTPASARFRPQCAQRHTHMRPAQELFAARGLGQAGRRVHPGGDQGEARG
jgi:hypothetical protein